MSTPYTQLDGESYDITDDSINPHGWAAVPARMAMTTYTVMGGSSVAAAEASMRRVMGSVAYQCCVTAAFNGCPLIVLPSDAVGDSVARWERCFSYESKRPKAVAARKALEAEWEAQARLRSVRAAPLMELIGSAALLRGDRVAAYLIAAMAWQQPTAALRVKVAKAYTAAGYEANAYVGPDYAPQHFYHYIIGQVLDCWRDSIGFVLVERDTIDKPVMALVAGKLTDLRDWARTGGPA